MEALFTVSEVKSKFVTSDFFVEFEHIPIYLNGKQVSKESFHMWISQQPIDSKLFVVTTPNIDFFQITTVN